MIEDILVGLVHGEDKSSGSDWKFYPFLDFSCPHHCSSPVYAFFLKEAIVFVENGPEGVEIAVEVRFKFLDGMAARKTQADGGGQSGKEWGGIS